MSTNSTSNDQADLASQVEAVKNNVIGEKTVKMYLRGISCYLVWLYQNKSSLLSNGLLEVVGNNEEAYLEHNEAGVGSLKKDALQPNTITEEWHVSGMYRIGIVALRELAVGEEVIFNYGKHYDLGSCKCNQCQQ
ncbi:hypothetical protein GQ600_12869 [Phytophthora cactorum]|nr:hypothetical protein GQ600_12869 [Phytophthora cactorum]